MKIIDAFIQRMIRMAKDANPRMKAQRLIRDGKVTVAKNTPTLVTGVVQGDHGTYNCTIYRTDPNSHAISFWECECPWNQYAWDRTRQWKHLEGRPCSHVTALSWKARSTPLDMTDAEEGYKPAPGQRTKPFTPKELEQQEFDRNEGTLPGLKDQGEQQQIDSLPRTFMPDDSWQPAKPEITPEQRDPKVMLRQPLKNPFLPDRSQQSQGPDNPLFNSPQRQPMQLNDFVQDQPAQPGPGQMSIPGLNPPGWEDPANPNNIPGTYSSWRESGLNGDLPEGLEISMTAGHSEVWFEASIDGEKVGTLDVVKGGTLPTGEPYPAYIIDVRVNQFYRRQGIASAMLARARQELGDVQHSADLSNDGQAWADKVGSLDDRIFDPLDDVLIDVQLNSPESPDTWVPARVVQHIPDTEGEAWDEDDYIIEWKGEVPDDPWCQANTEGGKCEVPASWVHAVPEDFGDQEPVWPEEKALHRASVGIPVFLVNASEFHYASDEGKQIEEALKQGRRVVFALRNPVSLEARMGKIPVPGAQPIGENEDGLPIYRWQELGWDPVRQRRVLQSEQFENQVGSPELRGQYGNVQPRRSGEIYDYEPLLKMVYVHIPIHDMGKLAPTHLEGWVDLGDITLLDTENNLRSPFRASKTAAENAWDGSERDFDAENEAIDAVEGIFHSDPSRIVDQTGQPLREGDTVEFMWGDEGGDTPCAGRIVDIDQATGDWTVVWDGSPGFEHFRGQSDTYKAYEGPMVRLFRPQDQPTHAPVQWQEQSVDTPEQVEQMVRGASLQPLQDEWRPAQEGQ